MYGMALFGLILLLAACGSAPEAPPPPPPPEVTVVTLKTQRLELSTELPGRTTAYLIAEVRPQVSGVILKRLFTEGAEVKAGEQLYQIDPAPYQAAYDSAAASLQRSNASLVSAHLLSERYKPLVAAKAVSRQDYDNAVASEQEYVADVASGKAAEETARINLQYTKLLSPITGRTGRSSVTEGALVTSDQTTTLVTVQQLDPIYVDFTQPSTLLLRLRRELAAGQLQSNSPDQAQVSLTLEDGVTYEQTGQLQFSEVTVDEGTGSVTLRAVFPNPQRLLLPGMFVRARLVEGVKEDALLVPQKGVTHNPKGLPVALVVGADNKVALKVLTTDRAIGDQWLVSSGLQAGDRVIVEGLQKVAPGATVNPVELVGTPTEGQPAAGNP